MRKPAPVDQAHTQPCQNAVLVCDNGRANAPIRLSTRAFQRGHRHKHTILQGATAGAGLDCYGNISLAQCRNECLWSGGLLRWDDFTSGRFGVG
jgi:hypothetical protein